MQIFTGGLTATRWRTTTFTGHRAGQRTGGRLVPLSSQSHQSPASPDPRDLRLMRCTSRLGEAVSFCLGETQLFPRPGKEHQSPCQGQVMHNWTILHRTLGLQDTSLLHPIKERLLWEGDTEDTLKFLLTTGGLSLFNNALPPTTKFLKTLFSLKSIFFQHN